VKSVNDATIVPDVSPSAKTGLTDKIATSAPITRKAKQIATYDVAE
jgi:hypothetical protein